MLRSLIAMPVSSVCSSTRSAPRSAPCSPAAVATSPLRLLVFASKLPPTVSGQVTVTSPLEIL
jgi:hypothetical protein